MKKLFSLLFITIFFSGCERDYIRNNTLPPLTHTGDNTAGCLVNGEVFLPKGFSPWGMPILSCAYEDGSYFPISINRKLTNEMKSVFISYKGPLQENIGVVYALDSDDIGYGGFGMYSIYYSSNSLSDNTSYVTNIDFKGELVFTYLNLEKRIISGTFWFDAVNSKGEVIEVRDGRFDMEY